MDSYWSKIKGYILKVDEIHDERFKLLSYELYSGVPYFRDSLWLFHLGQDQGQTQV